ncbi:hypothetical protein LAJ19_20475 (plasmid) [Deinococcus taeanensis]|uniref:hypothetical protein n=1 Tax=Deinococcus taeanensis TaxID=2737050 RepID=UPI001CDBF92B|nr:hypothetical protein [Deinococcus taeanensis]UBV45186.1 hypothetical protein LAJ19_20475 [Deinococcus taeanensis]
MSQLLRDLITDPLLLLTPLEVRPTVEWEEQEWCPSCEQYVPLLLLDCCLACLEGNLAEESGAQHSAAWL